MNWFGTDTNMILFESFIFEGPFDHLWSFLKNCSIIFLLCSTIWWRIADFCFPIHRFPSFSRHFLFLLPRPLLASTKVPTALLPKSVEPCQLNASSDYNDVRTIDYRSFRSFSVPVRSRHIRYVLTGVS